VFLACDFDPTAGSALVPGEAIAWMKGKTGSIGVEVSTTTRTNAGGWAITGTAYSTAVTPAGASASSISVSVE
jgi:hypothetical protein